MDDQHSEGNSPNEDANPELKLLKKSLNRLSEEHLFKNKYRNNLIKKNVLMQNNFFTKRRVGNYYNNPLDSAVEIFDNNCWSLFFTIIIIFLLTHIISRSFSFLGLFQVEAFFVNHVNVIYPVYFYHVPFCALKNRKSCAFCSICCWFRG